MRPHLLKFNLGRGGGTRSQSGKSEEMGVKKEVAGRRGASDWLGLGFFF
jgi:hypothetical protein